MQKIALLLLPLITIRILIHFCAHAQNTRNEYPTPPGSVTEIQTIHENLLKKAIGFSVHVPTMPMFQIHAKPVPPRKWLDAGEKRNSVNAAIDFILNLAHDANLSTKQDQALFQLLKKYKTGRKKMNIITAPESARDFIVMGYSCKTDAYAMGDWHTPTPLLAITLYHEITHELSCENILEYSRTPSRAALNVDMISSINRCDVEAPAYASSIRLFMAIVKNNLLPREIPISEETGDTIKGVLDAWHALLQGKDYFCSYLKKLYAGTPLYEN